MTDYHPITAAIRDAFTTTEENTEGEEVPVNLTDALLTLAAAIDRLARNMPY